MGHYTISPTGSSSLERIAGCSSEELRQSGNTVLGYVHTREVQRNNRDEQRSLHSRLWTVAPQETSLRQFHTEFRIGLSVCVSCPGSRQESKGAEGSAESTVTWVIKAKIWCVRTQGES